jgi:glucose-6-phosphate 1-dehydrogenase
MSNLLQAEREPRAETRPQVKPAAPCVLVIFGAAGDLARRLLVPALYNLRRANLLPEEFAVVGVARSKQDEDAFRRDIGGALRAFAKGGVADRDWEWLAARMTYVPGDFDDPALYERLARHLAKVGATRATGCNVLFYLATPPQVFAPIIRRLGAAGLTGETEAHWRRVIIEKPFGTDLRSAQELNREVLAVLSESQIYRIDHYLGKETVQNILVLRFGNGIFEPLWNLNHIDHVQITVAEALDVEQRGKFYEQTGALRDMVPNHLFQLLALVAMEPPTCFAAEAVRTEKSKVLEAVHRFGPQDARRNVVRGQYGGGTVAGKVIVPYQRAPNVAPDSTTETYVALKLMMDNWRWAGVPIYLRTGKALARRRSEIVIQFKPAPLALFRDTPVERLTRNDLVLHIQPEEGVTLRFGAKIPGPEMHMGAVEMKFDYQDYFNAAPSTGYETLIYDCMNGDATLFKRADDIEAGWRIVQPVLDAWAAEPNAPLPIYPAGSSGPTEADALLARDGRHWRALDGAVGGTWS